jgi:RNA polymerase sigma factor (sigma-70 family)
MVDVANRPAAFDAGVVANLPKLRRMASKLVDRDQREDLVNSTVEAGLRYWRSYDPAKKLSVWLVYQMRHAAFEGRRKVMPTETGALDRQTVPATQEEHAEAQNVMRLVDASPYADVMRLVASGHTSEEIAEIYGVTRQRVHQKIQAFRRSARRAA